MAELRLATDADFIAAMRSRYDPCGHDRLYEECPFCLADDACPCKACEAILTPEVWVDF
jgi:hypothetical protein